jgi:hypothetical protein
MNDGTNSLRELCWLTLLLLECCRLDVTHFVNAASTSLRIFLLPGWFPLHHFANRNLLSDIVVPAPTESVGRDKDVD